MTKKVNNYDVSEIMLARTKQGQEIFVYQLRDNLYFDVTKGNTYEKKELQITKNLSEILNNLGLSAALKRHNGTQITSLPLEKVKDIIKLIKKKHYLGYKEVQQIKDMSHTIACYVSYFLGFNIEHMPNLSVPLVKEGQITSVLIPGTKLLKFRRELAEFIEIELYLLHDTAFNVCISCDEGMLDYRVKGILKRLEIDDTVILKKNHFSLSANIDTISVKGENSNKPIICIEPRGTKIKKLI